MVIDGRRVATYARAFVAGGRVFTPASLLLRAIADRIWLEGDRLVVERDGRRVRVAFLPKSAVGLDATYVAIGPLLRQLGERVQYRARSGYLDVRTPPAAPIASATPFQPQRLAPPARPVFTPEPEPTARPVWNGSPLPRRTPLPFPPEAARNGG